MEKFRWCFIGTGTLANKVAKQILESGRHEIVSCYTRNFEKGKAFGETYGAKAYENVMDAINDERVDGVYIVTPHNAHYRYAKMALEAKKPVLLEKAFTVYGEDTEDLIRIAKENDTYICEAMWTWFAKGPNDVKEMIANNALGKIKKVSFTYHLKSINYAPRVSDPKRAGGALLDITVYPLTYSYVLWGMPKTIKAEGVIENGIDVGEDIVLSYDNLPDVKISASIADFKGLEKMTIKGDKGTIKIPFYHFLNTGTLKKGLFKKEKFGDMENPRINYVIEFDAVSKEMKEGLKESRYIPLKQTLDVMHIMDEVRKQIGLVYDNLE